ncbi:MAG: carboxypeptidase regulatory-like domain-containing protein [Terriglobales bacterium]
MLLALALFALLPASRAAAQSTTSGDISGLISDPSGAAIPGATVTLTNAGTGATNTTTTNAKGTYRFSLLPPGNYVVSAAATGFSPQKAKVAVSVGQVQAANIALQVGAATQTVTVTGEVAPVQTNNGNVSTSFSPSQIAMVPNSGGDLTQTVQTSPGATMNTQAGFGNFSTFGLPATSNLFTVNGQDDNDPFLNLNNSGATNLMLGQNDVNKVTVTNNGYSGQYGELGGANVNYVTKSGSNDWHGNAIYYWNGRVMNANNFLNNASGSPRPFDNANRWAASFGGPVIRDKSFFWLNTEGLNVVLPTNVQAKIPSPQFQAATLANLAATGNGSQVPFYQGMFNLYNSAAGAGAAAPVPAAGSEPAGGCGGLSFTGLAAGAPCALQFQSTAGNHTHEWTLSGRYDQDFSPSDKVFVQLSMDRGVQATFTDPISPSFDISSNQPQYQGQANWTHAFGPSAVNQFIASASHYDAIFGTNPAARSAVLPLTVSFSGALFTRLGGIDYDFPQGRNVAQYGLVDDLSMTAGANTFKLGANYKINYVNDFDFGIGTTPHITTTLSDFFNGAATSSTQTFPTRLNQPIRVYGVGAYAEDDVAVGTDLHLTFAIRAEHDSNPVCTHNCFARLVSPFVDLSHDPSVPYNAIIQTGLAKALPSYRHILFQPRFGFAWTPFGSQSTVLRGGFGIFNDTFPATVADNFATNSPESNNFVVSGPLSPAMPGNVTAAATADNTAFLNAVASGGTVGSITASNPGFSAPSFFSYEGTVRPPRYQEWNLEVQHALGQNSSISVNYVGNHGIHEPIQNDAVNAFSPGFTGLPATAPDPRFGVVNQLINGGVSNYNGMTLSYNRRLSNSLQVQANYTWSHALDEVSNGGFLPFNFNTNTSILGVQDPNNIHGFNYGNADYDVRHAFNLSYVWEVPFRNAFRWGPDQLWRGWTLSGSLFTRSGLPLTVIDGNAIATLAANNFGPNSVIFANQLATGQSGSCVIDKQCLIASAFSPSTAVPTGFGNQTRNQFRGPKFFDTDLSVIKNTQIPGWEKGQLGLGIQFFNLFNHANFDQPVGDVASSSFGTIINTVSVPTSILGSFLGGDASPRIIQLTARITF